MDFVNLGSALSLRSFGRLGSSTSVLDFVHLGSSLSLRTLARLSSSLSVVGFTRFGSSLSARVERLGTSSAKRCSTLGVQIFWYS